MRGEVLYLVGPPGSGKSTLVAHLVRGLLHVEMTAVDQYHLTKDLKAGRDIARDRPVYWLEYFARSGPRPDDPVAWEWGRLAAAASKNAADAGWSRGTDRYDKCIHQWFFTWLKRAPAMPLVIAEGDRLGYPDGLKGMRECGYHVTLAYLDTPEEVCEARRRLRAPDAPPQNPSWVKGRRTKAERLAEAEGAIRLDGAAELWALEWALRDHPTVAALRAAREPEASYVEASAF